MIAKNVTKIGRGKLTGLQKEIFSQFNSYVTFHCFKSGEKALLNLKVGRLLSEFSHKFESSSTVTYCTHNKFNY